MRDMPHGATIVVSSEIIGLPPPRGMWSHTNAVSTAIREYLRAHGMLGNLEFVRADREQTVMRYHGEVKKIWSHSPELKGWFSRYRKGKPTKPIQIYYPPVFVRNNEPNTMDIYQHLPQATIVRWGEHFSYPTGRLP